nr:hypothetical protein [Tanacetum cinerariifolium]
TSTLGIHSLTSIGSPLYILNHHSAILYCGLVPCIERCSELIVAGELKLARGGGSGVIDNVDDDGEPCCVLETFDNNARGSAVG